MKEDYGMTVQELQQALQEAIDKQWKQTTPSSQEP